MWWGITHGPSLWLTAHALFGLILVAGAFGLLARAIALRSRPLIIAMSFGAFGVLAAGFNGGSFLNYHEDFSSMLMASGFTVAMLSYIAGLAFGSVRTP